MAGQETINADGLLMRFGGDQGTRTTRTAVTVTRTKGQELVMTVKLPGPARTIYPGDGSLTRFTQMDTPLPAGCFVKTARVLNKITPAGGTSFSVDTYQLNGTLITSGGILTTGGGAGANVNALATQDLYLGVTTTGTYTAGVIEVIVTYDII